MTKVATSRARVINEHFYPHAERTERLLPLKIKKDKETLFNIAYLKQTTLAL